MVSSQQALIVGAGIVGVCTGLYLQREGFRVTLLERAEPGRGCSYGNGAALGFGSCVPLSMPGIVRRVPGMLLDPYAPLKIRLSGLSRTIPWMLRFRRECNWAHVEKTADARNTLLSRLFDAYEPLIDAARAHDLIRRCGMLTIYESDAAYAGDAKGRELRHARGVEVRHLSGDEVRELEPALGLAVKHGAFMPQVGVVANPLRLTQTLLRHFLASGGTLVKDRAVGFDMDADGVTAVRGESGRHAADLFVIAAGAWSRDLARMLGTSVPLVGERGYHVQIPNAGISLGRSVVSAERNIAFLSLEPGFRIVGGSEFAALDAPPDRRRIERMVELTRQVFPSLRTVGQESWVGPRPSLPDSRPVVDRSPRHANVFFNFGHDHIGLALAGITGKLTAELAAGRTPNVDISAYRADRF